MRFITRLTFNHSLSDFLAASGYIPRSSPPRSRPPRGCRSTRSTSEGPTRPARLRGHRSCHHREGEHQDLAAIRRIGQRLGIAHHTRVEHDFSRLGHRRAERKATPHRKQPCPTPQTRFHRQAPAFPFRHLCQCMYLQSSRLPSILRLVSLGALPSLQHRAPTCR